MWHATAAPPPVSAPPVRATVTVQQDACADELLHKHTTNALVSDPRPKCRGGGTGLTAVRAPLARSGRALPPDPLRVVDVGARRFVSNVVDAQGGRRASGVCRRGDGLPLGGPKCAVHAHQLPM